MWNTSVYGEKLNPIVQSLVDFIANVSSTWISLVIAPFKNLDMLWIIVPIYLSWFFAEWYQEKKGTSFGNAISNGVVVLWVGIDWIRYLIREIGADKLSFEFSLVSKFLIAGFSIVYGLMIVVFGIRGNKFVKFFGRIREVSYIMILFTPIVYGAVSFDLFSILAVLTFLPVFYFVVEIFTKILPSPKTYDEDESMSSSSSSSLFSSKPSSSSDPFSSTSSSSDPFSSKSSSLSLDDSFSLDKNPLSSSSDSASDIFSKPSSNPLDTAKPNVMAQQSNYNNRLPASNPNYPVRRPVQSMQRPVQRPVQRSQLRPNNYQSQSRPNSNQLNHPATNPNYNNDPRNSYKSKFSDLPNYPKN